MKINRRRFNSILATGVGAIATPIPVVGQSKPQVVVVGGGAGGATAARYLAANDKVDVTLIDSSDSYTTCFYSNLYLGGFRTFDSITHNYENLRSNFGINVVKGYVTEIDRDAQVVKLDSGQTFAYDRAVVAPGIDLNYNSIPGYSEEAAEIAPHAWQGGKQTALLREKMDALVDGRNIVMVAPPNPYRCPPGPYERASMMAHMIKTRGFKNSRVTILDTKPKFSKQGLFSQEWQRLYPDIIEWFPPDVHGGIIGIDAKAGIVETDLDSFEGDLLNPIPAMKAGAVAENSGLTDDSGFCPVDGASMRSRIDEKLFVVGDASIAGAMPKSAFSANSQARVAATNILSELTGSQVYPAAYANTCWSLISPNNGVKVGAAYSADDTGNIVADSTFISQPGESRELRKSTYEESIGWYDSIIADMFG